jgi:hypothetical protein
MASVSSDRRAQCDLATTLNRIGLLLADTSRPGEAEAESRRVLAILYDLTEDYPTVTGFRSLPAQVHTNLGALLSEPGRPAEAEAESRAALAIARDSAGENPTVTGFRSKVADAHNDLGGLFRADDQASGGGRETPRRPRAHSRAGRGRAHDRRPQAPTAERRHLRAARRTLR